MFHPQSLQVVRSKHLKVGTALLLNYCGQHMLTNIFSLIWQAINGAAKNDQMATVEHWDREVCFGQYNSTRTLLDKVPFKLDYQAMTAL